MEKKITLAVILALCLCLISCSNTYYDNSLDRLENIENELHNIADDLEELKPETTVPIIDIPNIVIPDLPKYLNLSNAKDYLNFQIIFGNVEQIGSSLSCMAYVIVSPRSNYTFEDASVTISLNRQSLLGGYWYINTTFPYSVQNSTTISIDNTGRGMASFYLYNSGDGTHPLDNAIDWTCEVQKATGRVLLDD